MHGAVSNVVPFLPLTAQGTCYGYVLAVADAAIMELTGARWRACISERRSRHVR